MDEVPDKIWDEVDEHISDVSDEIGEERLSDDYLLKYEGWGGICIEAVWLRMLEEQGKKGIETESEHDIDEREEACLEFAKEQTYRIIVEEWIPQLVHRGLEYIEGGFIHGGLYGRAYALFRTSRIQDP
jgi:hypothetical protein